MRRITEHERARGQIYNRFRVLTTFYRKRTLLVMLPSLLAFESALIASSVVNGFGGAYFDALRQAWRDRSSALAARRELQQRRKVPDSEVFWSGRVRDSRRGRPGPRRRARSWRSCSDCSTQTGDWFAGLNDAVQ